MDLRHPYTEDAARVHLLYRLPTAPAPRRLLVVAGTPPACVEMAASWGEGAVAGTDADGLLRLAAERQACFDAVALPATLQPRVPRSGIANQRLLQAAARLLGPGGVVVGHLEHARALRRLARPAAWVGLAAASVDRDAIGSPAACRRLLQRAGLVEPECYYVQPSIDAPMGLVPSEPAAARAHFLRWVRSSRHHRRWAGQAARIGLCWAGLGGTLQRELFFWARKPC